MYFPVLTDFSIFLVSILPGESEVKASSGFWEREFLPRPPSPASNDHLETKNCPPVGEPFF